VFCMGIRPADSGRDGTTVGGGAWWRLTAGGASLLTGAGLTSVEQEIDESHPLLIYYEHDLVVDWTGTAGADH